MTRPRIVSLGRDWQSWDPEWWGSKDRERYREIQELRAMAPPAPPGFGGLHAEPKKPTTSAAVDAILAERGIAPRRKRARTSEVDRLLDRLGVRERQSASTPTRRTTASQSEESRTLHRSLGSVLRVW